MAPSAGRKNTPFGNWPDKPFTWDEEGAVTPEELFNRFEAKLDGLMASIGGVADRITRLETQIKSSDDHRSSMASELGTVKQEIGELKSTVRILEERYANSKVEMNEMKSTVAKLEQARWWIVGAAAGFSTALSVLVMVVDHFLSKP